MTNLPDWEHRLRQQLDEIRSSADTLTNAASKIRGRSEIRGITVEVDLTGAITTLLITPAAMRWSPNQLSSVLLDCQRRARAEAAAKAEQLLPTADPRLRSGIQELRGVPDQTPSPHHVEMTEDEIQAADDAYYERRNTGGWNR